MSFSLNLCLSSHYPAVYHIAQDQGDMLCVSVSLKGLVWFERKEDSEVLAKYKKLVIERRHVKIKADEVSLSVCLSVSWCVSVSVSSQ